MSDSEPKTPQELTPLEKEYVAILRKKGYRVIAENKLVLLSAERHVDMYEHNLNRNEKEKLLYQEQTIDTLIRRLPRHLFRDMVTFGLSQYREGHGAYRLSFVMINDKPSDQKSELGNKAAVDPTYTFVWRGNFLYLNDEQVASINVIADDSLLVSKCIGIYNGIQLVEKRETVKTDLINLIKQDKGIK